MGWGEAHHPRDVPPTRAELAREVALKLEVTIPPHVTPEKAWPFLMDLIRIRTVAERVTQPPTEQWRIDWEGGCRRVVDSNNPQIGEGVRDDGFDLDAHAAYVAAGGCPFVEGKTYCNGRAGDHPGGHWATYDRGGQVPAERVLLRNARRIDHPPT